MKKINFVFWAIIIFILGILICASIFDFSFLSTNRFVTNMKVVSALLFGAVPLFIAALVAIGVLTSKWVFKIERLSLGGFNLMFDNPEKLYKKTIKSFLDTKRTIFKIDFDRDNFEETFNSFYKTYEFFRNEMKILDNEKRRGKWSRNREQIQLYDVTNNIIQVLNEFLTNHQNNFRRWYKHVSDTNEIEVVSGDTLKFHITPIDELQKHYYRYEQLCQDFKEINNFFCSEVNNYFKVELHKWERG